MVDIPANTTTTAEFLFNELGTVGTFSGVLETPGDHDWIRITLVSGFTYEFFLHFQTVGFFSGDSVLTLRDSTGVILATNNDISVSSQNSFFSYTPIATGTFYVDVSENGDNDRGAYSILYTALSATNLGFGPDDDIVAGAGGQRIIGGAGDDVINLAGGGIDALGEQGDDVLSGNASNNVLAGGLGNDAIDGANGNDFLSGDSGDDLLQGGEGEDTMVGGDGLDDVFGGGGNDIIQSGAGEDFINGGEGDDTIAGLDDDDMILGEAGNDIILGGDGNDFINGQSGADNMFGGRGDDIYHVDDQGDSVTEEFNEGIDLLRTLVSLNASNPLPDGVENAQLNGVGNFLVVGNSSSNVMNGNPGINQLRGLAGNDVLFGFDGNDVILGGTGRDQMAGGNGADDFHFDDRSEMGNLISTRDVITDFVVGVDDLDFNTMDANSVAGGNQNFVWRGTAAFSGAGQLRYIQSGGNTIVQGNLDGNLATVEFEVQLNGLLTLSAGDVVL